MNANKCPLCGRDNCQQRKEADITTSYICSTYKTTVRIANALTSPHLFSEEHQNKMLNLICERIVDTPLAPNGNYWAFYNGSSSSTDYSDSHIVDINSMMINYPQTFMETVNRFLLSLSHLFPGFGDIMDFYWSMGRLCFPKDFFYYAPTGMFGVLEQLDYVKKINNAYVITAIGWKQIEELRKEHITKKQAFIAMAFGEQTAEIREGFREAITASGYTMRAIDEKEHNNQIVPEIFYEIERSKFVVVDVTYPNYGAYYEAGYAYGLGKEVIVCCSKEAFENKDGTHVRPHFDISQKSMVIWDDIDDLKERLQRRIEATVK